MHLAQALLTNVQCSGGSRSLQRKQEPWRWEAQLPAIRSWQWSTERITEADPLTTTWEVAKELDVDHSMVIQHLKQTGKVKKLNQWVPHELTKNKKNVILKCRLFLFYAATMNHFDRIVTCEEKWTVYDNQWQPAQWLDPEEASKHFPKSDLHQKKVVVTVWWSAAHLIHYSFLNPSETITSEKHAQQIDEMHGKLQCLQLALVNRMGPVLLHDNAWPHVAQPMLQKLNELGYGVLLHLPYLPDLSLANWLPLLQASQQLFAG